MNKDNKTGSIMNNNNKNDKESNDLIIALWDLCDRIAHHGGISGSDSAAEQYKYFCTNSSLGADCGYARKARDNFEKLDYEEVKELFLSVLKLYREVEGPSFGNS